MGHPNYPARYQLQYFDPVVERWKKQGNGANTVQPVITRCRRRRIRAAETVGGVREWRVWDTQEKVDVVVEGPTG